MEMMLEKSKFERFFKTYLLFNWRMIALQNFAVFCPTSTWISNSCIYVPSLFSYSSSKWVVKQQRQLTTSTTHMAQELLTNIQGSGGSRSFAKEMRALKMRSAVAGHWKLTKINWEDHQNWSSYSYTRSCWRTQCGPLYGHSAFRANWKGEQDQQVGASWANANQKGHCFEVSSSLLCKHSEPFFNQIVTCDEKCIL